MPDPPAQVVEENKEHNEENVVSRAVAFPEEPPIHEKVSGGPRIKGPDMKRELTKDEKDLAAAGYDHLEEAKSEKGPQKAELKNVDIVEHHLSLDELQSTLNVSFNAKEPSSSHGLTKEEAAARLARDGPNQLTPPKKKSALRRVCSWFFQTVVSFPNESFFSVSTSIVL
jgi:sodium/potassium-transporting ATPase subunit alpha